MFSVGNYNEIPGYFIRWAVDTRIYEQVPSTPLNFELCPRRDILQANIHFFLEKKTLNKVPFCSILITLNRCSAVIIDNNRNNNNNIIIISLIDFN